MNKQHLVIFLQNAWSEIYAGGTWPQQSWLRVLHWSRSGQRLKILVDDLSVCENTTPTVGHTEQRCPAGQNAHSRGSRCQKARRCRCLRTAGRTCPTRYLERTATRDSSSGAQVGYQRALSTSKTGVGETEHPNCYARARRPGDYGADSKSVNRKEDSWD